MRNHAQKLKVLAEARARFSPVATSDGLKRQNMSCLILFLMIFIWEGRTESFYTVGFDFGSAGLFMDGGEIDLVTDEYGNTRTPSVVCIRESGLISVRRDNGYDNEICVHDVKLLLDKLYNDPFISAINNDISIPYSIVNKDGLPVIEITFQRKNKNEENQSNKEADNEKIVFHFTPKELVKVIIKHLKTTTEKYIGNRIHEVVISVPTSSSFFYRRELVNACESVGLKVKRIAHEQSLVSLAYSYSPFNSLNNNNQKVLFYQLGGGYFGTSVVIIEDGVSEVLSSNSNSVCPRDFNSLVMEYILKSYQWKTGKNLDSKYLFLLRKEIEVAKIKLNYLRSIVIQVNDTNDSQKIVLKEIITQEKYHELIFPTIKETIAIMDQVIKDSNSDKIEKVVLSGGSSQIPLIRQMIREYFNNNNIPIFIFGEEVESESNSQRNSVLENFHWRNPFDTIVVGAAILGGINNNIDGSESFFLFDNIITKPISIELYGGELDVIISSSTSSYLSSSSTRKNSNTINNKKVISKSDCILDAHDKCSNSKNYSLVNSNNQKSVMISIYEGEGVAYSDNNKLLGVFQLKNLNENKLLRSIGDNTKIEITVEYSPFIAELIVTTKEIRDHSISHELSFLSQEENKQEKGNKKENSNTLKINEVIYYTRDNNIIETLNEQAIIKEIKVKKEYNKIGQDDKELDKFKSFSLYQMKSLLSEEIVTNMGEDKKSRYTFKEMSTLIELLKSTEDWFEEFMNDYYSKRENFEKLLKEIVIKIKKKEDKESEEESHHCHHHHHDDHHHHHHHDDHPHHHHDDHHHHDETDNHCNHHSHENEDKEQLSHHHHHCHHRNDEDHHHHDETEECRDSHCPHCHHHSHENEDKEQLYHHHHHCHHRNDEESIVNQENNEKEIKEVNQDKHGELIEEKHQHNCKHNHENNEHKDKFENDENMNEYLETEIDLDNTENNLIFDRESNNDNSNVEIDNDMNNYQQFTFDHLDHNNMDQNEL